MTLFKKTAVLAFATFASAAAVAADPITHTIQLVATVPTSDFYVEPVDPTWVGKEQVLAWNPLAGATGNLGSWRQDFDVKHTAGSIHASLDTPAVIYGGSNQIELDVAFNGKPVTLAVAEVVSNAEAGGNYRTSMSIVPKVPAGGYKAGRYTGNVAVNFDAVVTP
jgi:hypothetical protein